MINFATLVRLRRLLQRGAQAAPLIALSIYRSTLSPVLVSLSGGGCRFEPTCSRYASAAIHRHGLVRGTYLALGRLLRCRPGGGWGYDPVPLTIPKFSRERPQAKLCGE